jgi:hypothetical protein
MAVKASGAGSFFSYGYNYRGGGPVTMDLGTQLGLGGDVFQRPAVRKCLRAGCSSRST